MTRDELIAALANDQEITRTKAEDILQAITDLCADTLAKGQPFNFGEIGFLAVRPPLPVLRGNLRGNMIFQSSEKFRARIGLIKQQPKKPGSYICDTCGLQPVKVHVYDECDSCMIANEQTKQATTTRSYNQRTATR